MLDRLKAPKGAVTKKKRVGRGEGGGLGKTSGRGSKGQNSRSGVRIKPGFEGGQMPLQRRLPKRGFTNIFRVENRIVNVGVLAKTFEAGSTADSEALIEKRLIRDVKGPIKVLGQGEIDFKLTVKANSFSKTAVRKIEAAGGVAEVI